MKNIFTRIEEFNKPRLPDMVKLKYRFMGENLYRFYRGTCHIFYEDLQSMGNILPSPQTWISGDLHLENFGSYKGDNRLVYFDINDFDEAILAPASWELVRLVTSIFIAFQTLKINQKKALHMASLFLKSYAKTLALGKQNYIEPQTASGIVYDFLSTVSKRKRKRILKKRTIKNKKGLLILKKHPKHFPIEEPLKTELSNHINNWLHFDGNSPYNYQVIDATFRVAGTGSLGLNRYVLLLKSINNVGEKYLLIDMKEAIQSSLQPYIQIQQPEWPLQAERIRSVQYIMQNRAPALLSTSVFRNKSYLIQEMQPEKDSINFKLISNHYRNMCQVINDMGMLTASAHLRGMGRMRAAAADDLIAYGADNHWHKSVLNYAIEYSATLKQYYRQYKEAYINTF